MLQEIPYLGGRDRKCKLEEAIRINTQVAMQQLKTQKNAFLPDTRSQGGYLEKEGFVEGQLAYCSDLMALCVGSEDLTRSLFKFINGTQEPLGF